MALVLWDALYIMSFYITDDDDYDVVYVILCVYERPQYDRKNAGTRQ